MSSVVEGRRGVPVSYSHETWSSYKQHNTVKFLVAVTPNGAVCFLSPVYVVLYTDCCITTPLCQWMG